MSLKCVNARFDDGQPHNFDVPMSAGTDMDPLLFCRNCGEVRRLALTVDEDGPPVPTQSRRESNAR